MRLLFFDYYLTARCLDCISEQNSVRFSCCGKLGNDDFKQNDERWKMEHYDNICSTEPAGSGRYRPVYSCDDPIFNKPEYKDKKYKFTIWGKGCALTALATLINYYKNAYNLPISSTNPKELNEWFKKNEIRENNEKFKCYTSKGKVSFKCIDKYSYGKIKNINNIDITEKNTIQILIEMIESELINNRPVIIRISNPSHFMLVIGKCATNFIVSDPGGNIKIYNPFGNRKLLGIRLFGF